MKGEILPYYNPESLNIPPGDIKIVRRNGVFKVFDPLRKKYFCLTPEEYVRQRFVWWLIHELGYPPSLMANEVGINLNNTIKRCDTVIYNKNGQPMVIVEYKAPGIEINQKVFDQIARYTMSLHAPWLIVSNGISHYCCLMTDNFTKYSFIPTIPEYKDLMSKEIEIDDES